MSGFQFDNFQDFLLMGGYAQYVWPVYILFALFFVITVIPPVLSRKRVIRQLKARQTREENL